MKIIFLKNRNKKLNEFKKKEWKLFLPKYYGKNINWNYWDKKKFRIKAEDNEKIVGALVGEIMAGVLYITELIVAHDKRGLGIGESILKETEKYAIKNKVHLIYLDTGEKWEAVKLYEKLGYKKAFLVKKFFGKKNFWLMTKYI